MKEIDLKLPVEEVNLVLKSLSKLPYEEVAGTIYKIKVQGDAQFEPDVPAEPVAEDKKSGPELLQD